MLGFTKAARRQDGELPVYSCHGVSAKVLRIMLGARACAGRVGCSGTARISTKSQAAIRMIGADIRSGPGVPPRAGEAL